MKNLGHYSKAIVALGGAFTVTGAALADGSVTGTEGFTIAAALITAVGVYLKRNDPATE